MAGCKNGILGLNDEWSSIDTGTSARCSYPPPGSICGYKLYDEFIQCAMRKTHVVVMFEGWNAPWEEEGGKTVPKDAQSTINSIRSGVFKEFNAAKIHKSSIQNDSLTIEAYATDTDDDVKKLAIRLIEYNHRNNGKMIIYGYSWGGDTAVELSKDLKGKGINVDLLITIDAAVGPFNGSAVRDTKIPHNVKININHYTTTPKSRVGSHGLPHSAEDSSNTLVKNISHTGPTHGQMDEETSDETIEYILDEIVGARVCD